MMVWQHLLILVPLIYQYTQEIVDEKDEKISYHKMMLEETNRKMEVLQYSIEENKTIEEQYIQNISKLNKNIKELNKELDEIKQTKVSQKIIIE